MENQSTPRGFSSEMNEEMGFVSEKKEEENQCLSMGRSKASLGGSWWWQNVKPFVNGGSAALLTDLQIILLGSASYYFLIKYDNEFQARLIKWMPRETFKTLVKQRLLFLPIEATKFTLPLGSFEILTRKVIASNHGIPLGIHQEACCAVFAGTVGAFVACPLTTASYLAETKMVTGAKKMTYGDVFRALYRIGANEGLSALWKPRVFYTSAAMYAGAGAVSAFVASACCIPVRNVQLHMRAMRPNADGKLPFTSSLDCALKVLKARGLVELYKGFPLFLCATLPITMMKWIMLEGVRDFEDFAGL